MSPRRTGTCPATCSLASTARNVGDGGKPTSGAFRTTPAQVGLYVGEISSPVSRCDKPGRRAILDGMASAAAASTDWTNRAESLIVGSYSGLAGSKACSPNHPAVWRIYTLQVAPVECSSRHVMSPTVQAAEGRRRRPMDVTSGVQHTPAQATAGAAHADERQSPQSIFPCCATVVNAMDRHLALGRMSGSAPRSRVRELVHIEVLYSPRGGALRCRAGRTAGVTPPSSYT